MNDQEFSERLHAELEAADTAPDELTRARLRAARRQALDQLERPVAWRLPALAAAASVALAAVLYWPPGDNTVQAVDAELLADLDLVLWLDDREG